MSTSSITSSEKRLIQAMRALGDSNRYRMFKIMMNRQDFCVSQIAGELNVSVSAISQHFKTFELLGLVDKRRDCQKICYSLKSDDELVKQLSKMVNEGE